MIQELVSGNFQANQKLTELILTRKEFGPFLQPEKDGRS
jgi:hypothetical protein